MTRAIHIAFLWILNLPLHKKGNVSRCCILLEIVENWYTTCQVHKKVCYRFSSLRFRPCPSHAPPVFMVFLLHTEADKEKLFRGTQCYRMVNLRHYGIIIDLWIFLKFEDFCNQNHKFFEFLTIFSNKNDQKGDFLGLKFLKSGHCKQNERNQPPVRIWVLVHDLLASSSRHYHP